MEFTTFNATSPDVVPATTEKVYDKYWLANFRIQAGNPTKPVRAVGILAPSRIVTVDDGQGGTISYHELKPNAQTKRIVVEDLFGEAEQDAQLAAAVEAVLAAVATRAAIDGIL